MTIFAKVKKTQKTRVSMHKGSLQKEYSNTEGQLFSIAPIFHKSVEVSFTAPDLSSQGGLLLMREYERKTGIIKAISHHIQDERCVYLLKHPYYEMLSQRVYQIAAGYADADDCDLLRKDSILKLCCERTPDADALSSQPTMTRLENKVTARELYHIGLEFVNQFIASYAEEPEVIILDCDDTNFDAHGTQQGTLFNNYYDEYCYMPLLIFEGMSGKMILPMLREGRRNKTTNIKGVLIRLITLMRKHWKKTQFIIRGDSHFCSPSFMDWAKDKPYVNFITGLSGNSVLYKKCASWVDMACKQYQYHKIPVKFYRTFRYRAGSWKNEQRVIVKIEVNEMGKNIRFVVTDFQHNSSRFLYESMYCGRGQMELYIKELKTYLEADRTSCHHFKANQFRLFMHETAYVILHGIKSEICFDTDLRNVSILTLREKILHTAVHIRNLKSKVKIEFPQNHPYRIDLEKILCRFEVLRRAG
jgi:hypothetical protein